MRKNCKLDMNRMTQKRNRSFELDDQLDSALLEAIVATRAKIDQAFAGRQNIPAKLKASAH